MKSVVKVIKDKRKKKSIKAQEYDKLKKYDLCDVLDCVAVKGSTERKINNYRLEYHGFHIKMNSQRYHLFKDKGCTCVKCGLKGTHFWLERNGDDDTPDNQRAYAKGYHFNLYGINEDGEEIMLTKDHIIPRSKGGKNSQSNYQVMCYECNQEKGNTL